MTLSLKQKTKKKTIKLLFINIVSALLFSFSFFYIKHLGFLILPAFILLFVLHERLKIKQVIPYGFLWGGISFGLYFIWVCELLLTKSGASVFLAISLYFFLVFYSSMLTVFYFILSIGLFKLLKSKLMRIFSFFTTTFLLFFFIEKNYLFFLEKNIGYPFLNPLIPLANYRWFLLLYGLFFPANKLCKKINLNSFLKKNKVIYVKPVVRSFNNNLNALTASQLIYHKLSSLLLEEYSNKFENIILLSPETFFPYPLNKNKKAIKLWGNLLPANTDFFVGSQREEAEGKNEPKFFQTVFQLKRSRIIDYYDKTLRAVFAEKIPFNCKNFEWANSLFLNGKKEFFSGKERDKLLKIDDQISIVPRICSEFFWGVKAKREGKGDFLFLFVNDSWFLPYFRRVLQNMTRLGAIELGVPIFYVGHKKLKIYTHEGWSLTI